MMTKECITAIWTENGRFYKSKEQTPNFNVNDEPELKVSLFKLTNSTMAYDLAFPLLQVNDTGTYICMSGSRLGGEGSYAGATFILTVKDPAAPQIRNRSSEIEEITWLEIGDHTTLNCEIESGFPASISWFQERDARRVQLDSSQESLRVDQPGVYEKPAKQKISLVWIEKISDLLLRRYIADGDRCRCAYFDCSFINTGYRVLLAKTASKTGN